MRLGIIGGRTVLTTCNIQTRVAFAVRKRRWLLLDLAASIGAGGDFASKAGFWPYPPAATETSRVVDSCGLGYTMLPSCRRVIHTALYPVASDKILRVVMFDV